MPDHHEPGSGTEPERRAELARIERRLSESVEAALRYPHSRRFAIHQDELQARANVIRSQLGEPERPLGPVGGRPGRWQRALLLASLAAAVLVVVWLVASSML